MENLQEHTAARALPALLRRTHEMKSSIEKSVHSLSPPSPSASSASPSSALPPATHILMSRKLEVGGGARTGEVKGVSGEMSCGVSLSLLSLSLSRVHTYIHTCIFSCVNTYVHTCMHTHEPDIMDQCAVLLIRDSEATDVLFDHELKGVERACVAANRQHWRLHDPL